MNDEHLVFESCPECWKVGQANALYLDGESLACPVHGEVSSQRKVEYLRAGSLFLLGQVPTRTPPVLNSDCIS
ncbi:MAG: hypothetical protein ABW166_18605 [Sedimenticola sp.]